MSENKYTYNAFISYSQDPDKEIAKQLEDGIERFGIGWHRLKKQKLFIFRDVTDLVPDKNLPEIIEGALSKSEFLIVLAQKKFSQNDFSWVNVEAEYFVKSCEKRGDDPTDHIILVVTDGEIAWDRNKNQWDYNTTNVLPQSLRQIFKHEPLYVDLRSLNDESVSKNQKNRVFKDARTAIVAKLLYKKPSEIQNQIIKLQNYVIGFIAIISIFFLILFVYAIIQKGEAVKNAEEARKQEQIAQDSAEVAVIQRGIAQDSTVAAVEQRRIAQDSTVAAVEQRRIAQQKAKEAEIQKGIAQDSTVAAVEQRRIAQDSTVAAVEQRRIAQQKAEEAETARAKTDTINKLIESENIALKALDFFKTLDDTLVSNMSLDIDSLAVNQRDSISKATGLFGDYGGINKEEHKNKLEALYTSNIMSDVFFSRSKNNLKSSFDLVYQTCDSNTIVTNLKGQIYDIDGKQNVKDSIDNFVEVTPVIGTDLLLYSDYKKNFKLFDIKRKTLHSIECKDISERNVFVSAYSENGKDLILKSKDDSIYQIQFTEENKSELSASISRDTFNMEYIKEILKKQDSTYTNYCMTGDSIIYWGNPNGEVSEYNLFQKKKGHTHASLKDRINQILFDKDNQILIVQVGANQLVLFLKLDREFTKIYHRTLGDRIDDTYLGKNGHIYVLYDRNRLIYWPVQNKLFQQQEEKFANQ